MLIFDQMTKRVEDDLLTYRNSPNDYPFMATVYTRYRLRDGTLMAASRKIERTFRPFGEPGLIDGLVRVSENEITPEDYVGSFGLLGFSNLAHRALVPTLPSALERNPEWGEFRHKFTQYHQEALKAVVRLPRADPIDWFLAHARTVALCVKFAGLFHEGDEHAILDAIQDLPAKGYAAQASMVSLPTDRWRESLRDAARPSELIGFEICNLISSNIRGVERWVDSGYGALTANPKTYFVSSSTIEAIYWQLADKIAAELIRRCEGCRRFFIARDKRQTYCPPFPGSTRSRCSSRLNTTNHRHR